MKRFKKKWLIISITITAAFFVLLFSLAFIFFGKIHFFAKASGELVSVREDMISSTISGIVSDIYINDGQIISANTAIMVINPANTPEAMELNIRIRNKELELQNVMNNIRDTEHMETNGQITTRESFEWYLRSQQKIQEVAAISQNIANTQALYEKGYSSQKELEGQQRIFQLNQEESNKLDNFQKYIIKQELSRQRAVASSIIAEIENLKKFCSNQVVYSTSAGMVIGIKDWKTLKGQFINKGEPIFKVIEPHNYYFKAYIREPDITKVTKDQIVLINLWAIPRTVFPPIKGTIDYFYPQPVYINSEQVYPVLCTLNLDTYKERNFLKPGMSGEVRIDTGEKSIAGIVFQVSKTHK